MSSIASPEDDERRSARVARRTLTLFVVAVAAVLIGVVVFLADPGGDATAGDPATSEVAAIGPRPGAELSAYLADRRQALTELDGRRLAVVSFAEYLDPRDAESAVGSDVDVTAWLVALPGAEPRSGGSVDEGRAATVTDARHQIEEIGALLPTVDDEDFAAFYRAELIRYRQVVDAAERPDVVFGAVVVGRVADLRAVGSRSAVRLVDLGGGTALATDAWVRGVRPEEAVTAGEPPFRP